MLTRMLVYFHYLQEWGLIVDYKHGILRIEMQTFRTQKPYEDRCETRYINPEHLKAHGNQWEYVEP